jgi:hypothetical protein
MSAVGSGSFGPGVSYLARVSIAETRNHAAVLSPGDYNGVEAWLNRVDGGARAATHSEHSERGSHGLHPRHRCCSPRPDGPNSRHAAERFDGRRRAPPVHRPRRHAAAGGPRAARAGRAPVHRPARVEHRALARGDSRSHPPGAERHWARVRSSVTNSVA